jgi:hypothetical protein
MDKINLIIDFEQSLSQEQQADCAVASLEAIMPLAPECFSLIGGGSGILLD